MQRIDDIPLKLFALRSFWVSCVKHLIWIKPTIVWKHTHTHTLCELAYVFNICTMHTYMLLECYTKIPQNERSVFALSFDQIVCTMNEQRTLRKKAANIQFCHTHTHATIELNLQNERGRIYSSVCFPFSRSAHFHITFMMAKRSRVRMVCVV